MKGKKTKFGIKPTIASLNRLLAHMKNYRFKYTSGLLLSSFAGDLAFNMLFTFSFLMVLAAGENKDISLLNQGIVFTAAGFLCVVILKAIGELLHGTATARASGDLRKKVFTHFNLLPFRWYEKNHSGEAASRLTTDIQETEKAWGEPLRSVVGTLMSGFGSAVVMFILDWRFSLIIIPIGILMFFLSTRFIEPVRKKSNQVQETHAELSKQLIDMLGSTSIVKLFSMSAWLTASVDKVIDKVFKIGMKRAHWVTAQEGVNVIAGIFTSVGGIILGSIFAMEGWFSVAKMVAMVQMSNGINSMFWQLGSRLTALQNSLAGADRVLDILDIPMEEEIRALPIGNGEQPLVSLNHVSFSYDHDDAVLQDITLDIEKGQMVAIVGGSGGGKSTLLKLLHGFYSPNEGEIRVSPSISDGGDSWRSSVAYVPQSNYLFSGTIKENIQYGFPTANQDDVIAAAKMARAHDFILELSDGYDTLVGERGSQLSGGQRQRIAIARALLKDASLILFDEATSSLDSRSEKLMQDAMDEMIEDRTAVIVAHRLSTVKQADKIIVLEDGKIIETGSHETLIAENGRYSYYYNMQFA